MIEGLDFQGLAWPQEVSAGQNITLVVRDSDPPKYVYLASDKEQIRWREQHEGGPGPNWSSEESAFWYRVFAPSKENVTLFLETEARLAVMLYLPEQCGWTISTTDLSRASCPVFNLTQPTAFWLGTGALDRPYRFRIDGEANGFFYDESLNPAGSGVERVYESTITESVVVVPRGGWAHVSFTITPALTPTEVLGSLLPWLLLAVLPLILFAVLYKRRREKTGGNRTEEERPRPSGPRSTKDPGDIRR